jgi:hypothetical protein
LYPGLIGPWPYSIASGEASIIQALDPYEFDQFTVEAPIRIVGIRTRIKAQIQMPWGTISHQLLHPFNPVTLSTTNTSFTYSDGTSTSVLAIQSGTLSATIPSGSPARRISAVQRFSFEQPLATLSRRSVLLG